MHRSEHILKGLSNQYYRATYKSMGFTTEDLKRPIIGIANAWSECVPGHYNLRQVAQRVKDGISRAGGTPIEFGVIGGCDGMGQGHDGMHFIMPSRELIANSIESMAQINLFDGLVLLGSCDKIVPGMLMAAARLDIPCIFLPGGPMEGGVEFDGRQADQTSSTEAYGMLSAGDVANYDMLAVRNSLVEHVPVYNLLSVLEARILNEGGQLRDEVSGEVTIALPAGRENLLFSSPDSIVVCGNQPDMIRRAIELHVTCVIVCQAEVDQELLDMDTDTCIII